MAVRVWARNIPPLAIDGRDQSANLFVRADKRKRALAMEDFGDDEPV